MKLEVTREFMELLMTIQDCCEDRENWGYPEAAITSEDIMKKMPPQSEEINLMIVNISGYLICYMENPSREVCLAAVKKAPGVLEYLGREFQTEEFCLAAAKSSPSGLSHVDYPTEEMFLAAVTANSDALMYIDNPSEEVCWAAAKSARDISRGLYIKDPKMVEKIRARIAKEDIK